MIKSKKYYLNGTLVYYDFWEVIITIGKQSEGFLDVEYYVQNNPIRKWIAKHQILDNRLQPGCNGRMRRTEYPRITFYHYRRKVN